MVAKRIRMEAVWRRLRKSTNGYWTIRETLIPIADRHSNLKAIVLL